MNVTETIARFAVTASVDPAAATAAGRDHEPGSAAAWVAAATGAGPADAVAVGVETALRTAASLDGHVVGGWDPACAAILVGTVAALARRDGLTVDATVRAIAIAATQAGGLAAAVGSPLGDFQRRRAAENAAQAVRLAVAGMTAPTAPLEGRRGLYALLAPAADPATVTDRLGEHWLLLDGPGT